MKSGLVQDKVFDALIDALSIEEVENILRQKKQDKNVYVLPLKPNPMTEEQKMKEKIRKQILRMGLLHPSK